MFIPLNMLNVQSTLNYTGFRIIYDHHIPDKSLIICEFFIFHLLPFIKQTIKNPTPYLFQKSIATTILKKPGARKKENLNYF
jgi:hypothetical protein